MWIHILSLASPFFYCCRRVVVALQVKLCFVWRNWKTKAGIKKNDERRERKNGDTQKKKVMEWNETNNIVSKSIKRTNKPTRKRWKIIIKDKDRIHKTLKHFWRKKKREICERKATNPWHSTWNTHTGKFVRRENLDENCSEKIQLQREKEESNKERKKRNIFIHVRGAAHTRNKETNRRKEQRKRKQNHNNNAPLTQERT